MMASGGVVFGRMWSQVHSFGDPESAQQASASNNVRVRSCSLLAPGVVIEMTCEGCPMHG